MKVFLQEDFSNLSHPFERSFEMAGSPGNLPALELASTSAPVENSSKPEG